MQCVCVCVCVCVHVCVWVLCTCVFVFMNIRIYIHRKQPLSSQFVLFLIDPLGASGVLQSFKQCLNCLFMCAEILDKHGTKMCRKVYSTLFFRHIHVHVVNILDYCVRHIFRVQIF